MNITVVERMAKLQNKRRSRVDPIDYLQTRLWVESTLKDYRISRRELEAKLSGESESSGIVLKWLRGVHYATQVSVDQVAKLYPGSSHIYDLPIFQLLKNKPISKSALKKSVASYLPDSGLQMWSFPLTQNGEDDGWPAPTTHIFDPETLFQRGDIYGFMGLLYLVRKAEIENDHFGHLESIKYAYRALPGLCRYKYFRRRWKEFYEALIGIQCRMPASSMMLMPKRDIIQKQVEAKYHMTLECLRPRDPATFNSPIELELPFLEARFFE